MPHASRRTPVVAAVSGSFPVDVGGSIRRIERTVRDARARGADLIVFPEAALGGYPCEAAPPGSSPAPALALATHSELVDRMVKADIDRLSDLVRA